MATAKQGVSNLIDSINTDDYIKAKTVLQDIVNSKVATKIADESFKILQTKFKSTDVSKSE